MSKEKDGLIDVTPKKNLAVLAHDFGELCNQIDEAEDIGEGVIEKFMEAKGELSIKVDSWIYKLDQAKHWVQFVKDRKKRVEKGYKIAQNIEKGMKQYVKYQLENNDIPFKGTEGTLYLHGQAEKVDHNINVENKTVFNCVDSSIADLIPGIDEYLKSHTFYSIDIAKIKADLKAGKKLGFAKLSKGKHVRVRA